MPKVTVLGGASHAGEVPAPDPVVAAVPVVDAPAEPPVVEAPVEPAATPAVDLAGPVAVPAEPDDTSRHGRRRRPL